MSMKGQITSLLKPKYEKAGYSLTSDEHFIYLWKDGKILNTFNGHSKSVEPIEKYIDGLEVKN